MIDQRRHKGPPGDRVRPERVDAAAAKDAEDWGRGDQRPGGVLRLLLSLSSDPAFPLGQIAADRQDLLPPPGPVRQGLGAFLRLALPLVAGEWDRTVFESPFASSGVVRLMNVVCICPAGIVGPLRPVLVS